MVCNNIECLPFQLSRNNLKDSNSGTSQNLNLNLNKLVGEDLEKTWNKRSQSNTWSLLSQYVVLFIIIYNPSKYWQLINNFSNSKILLFLSISLRYLRFGQFW